MWKRLIPASYSVLDQGRARLVIATCLGLIIAALALIVTWLVSGDLEGQTVIAALIFSLIMLGLVWLTSRRRVKVAAWLLILLLMLLITLDAIDYGLGSPASAAFFLPIVLAGCILNFWGGMGVAFVAAVASWGSAVAAYNGWYQPAIPFELSQLTFNAPVLTVLFLLIGLITGYWTRYLSRALPQSPVDLQSR
jgi:hypothetical protein